MHVRHVHGPRLEDRVLVVAADHPSLAGDVERFIQDAHDEPRFFGPVASANPKPSRSLLARLGESAPGFRVAATVDGRVIGLARVDHRGEVWLAVAADHRGHGVGTCLACAVVARSRTLGYTRLVMRSSRRSRVALALGSSMGFSVLDRGRGRIELVLDLAPAAHSA